LSKLIVPRGGIRKMSIDYQMEDMQNDLVMDDLVKLARRDLVIDIFRDLPMLKTQMEQETKW
jgi:hypothetical protein